jgi:DMSO/TMAO reductase YedYZ heme-binding membrane subunit
MMAPAVKRRMVWAAMILICCAPLVVWTASVHHPLAYIRLGGLPPGQQLYLLAKLSGLFALCLFWMQCLLALAAHAPLFVGFPAATPRRHRRLGAATALLILGHVALFVTATSLRTGHAAWELLLPDFTHGDYKFNIGLGVIAFWLVCTTVFAGWRTSRGGHRWKMVHRLWPLVFGFAFLHAFTIGTESRYGVMRHLVLLIAVSLCVAALMRWWRAGKGGVRRSLWSGPSTGPVR